MGVAAGGPNALHLSFFLNHAQGSLANMAPRRVVGCHWYSLVTVRDIRAGEELTVDYAAWDAAPRTSLASAT
jgi:SET domain-containing protein